MDQTKPAEWAMAKAQEVQDAILSMNPVTHSEYAAERIHIIARAIEAAANAATEQERERLEDWCHDAMSDVMGCIDLNVEEERGAIIWLQNVRAAIRKGGDND